MAVKAGTFEVITDLRSLHNIANTDIETRETINEAIVKINNVLVIKDSSGTAVKTIYGADDTV